MPSNGRPRTQPRYAPKAASSWAGGGATENITDPEQCLALAVIHKAFEDRAWGWVLRDPISRDFLYWCDLAEVDPEHVRLAATRHGGHPADGDQPFERIALAVARGPGRPRKDGRVARPHLRLVVCNN